MSATSPIVNHGVNHLSPFASREPSNEKNETNRKNVNNPVAHIIFQQSELVEEITESARAVSSAILTDEFYERMLVQAKLTIEIAQLDYRRAAQELIKRNYTQSQVAAVARVSQPAIAQLLKVASRDAQLQAGKAAASITEACKRFAIHQWNRAELIDFLATYDYRDEGKPDEFGEYGTGIKDTFLELETAELAGLIDESVIMDVDDRREARAMKAGD